MLPAACIVPETSARPGWIVPLVPIFSPLVHLSPVPETVPQEAVLRQLAQEERLLALTPAMPTAEAEKLRHLARSLAGTEAALHGEQLKQLILENLNQSDSQEKTSTLRQQVRTGTQKIPVPAPAEDLLWQERLLLFLADKAEREQEELAAAFSRISKQHHELLSSIGDQEHALLESLLPPETASNLGAWQPKRLRAWARLLAQTRMPRQGIWYITRQQDLAAQILEQHQLCTQGQILNLPELLLPACQSDAPPGWKPQAPRMQDCPGLFEAFSRLQGLAFNGATDAVVQEAASLFALEAPAWNALIRAEHAGDSGLCHLQLSILPGATFPQLLQNTLARTPAKAQSASTRAGRDQTQTASLFGHLKGNAQKSSISSIRA